jgi:hypothetical protein
VSKRLRGVKRAKLFHRTVLDLIAVFEEHATAAGLSAREIDAHVASTCMDVLCAIAEKRETYSGTALLDVFKQTLHEGAGYEQ